MQAQLLAADFLAENDIETVTSANAELSFRRGNSDISVDSLRMMVQDFLIGRVDVQGAPDLNREVFREVLVGIRRRHPR